MRLIPFIIFFIYVYLEVSFFILVANEIGVFLALLLILLSSLIGLSLIRSQALKNSVLMQQIRANSGNPTTDIMRGTSRIIAGLFFLVPGFLTDIIGLILLLPPVQTFLLRSILPKIVTAKFKGARFFTSFTTNNQNGYQKNNYQQNSPFLQNSQFKGDTGDDIIEGEFKRKD
ncbi:FxsA family protein [Orbaceae bacterium ESL0721]|nr:FxsA family protein [Orbaceae bacterium ESL0721]